jgi:hypothetical protein
MLGRSGRAALVVGADAAALVLLRPHFAQLGRHLLTPHAWLARIGADRALAEISGAGLWLAAAWLAVGLAAAAAGRLPGAAGRIATSAARAVLPRALYRMLAGSAGLGILLTPVAAAATPVGGATPTPDAPSPSGSVQVVPAPGWPVDRPADAASTSLPAPVWPSSRPRSAASPVREPSSTMAPTSPSARTSPPARTSRPAPPQGTSPPPVHGGSKAPPASAVQVTVHPGDSLWLIAAHRLGTDATAAQIAADWPRWYRANRSVVGADPALIRPGEVLRTPPPVPADSAADAEETST